MSSLMPVGTADEDMIDARGRHQRAQQHPHLVAIEPAVQDRDVLLLARDDMEHREPLHEAVLQFLQRLAEQHAAGGAVAVEQEEPAVRLARQHALDDRQDRRDAGAGGKADIDPRLVRRMARCRSGRSASSRRVGRRLSVHRRPSSRTRRHRPSSPRCAIRRHRGRSRSNRSGALPRRPWWCAGSDIARARSCSRRQARRGIAKVSDTASADSRRRSLTARRWKRGWDIDFRTVIAERAEAIQRLRRMLRFARNDACAQ